MDARGSWLGQEGIAPLGLAIAILLAGFLVSSCGPRRMQGILRARSGHWDGNVITESALYGVSRLGLAPHGVPVKLDFVPVGGGSRKWYVSLQGVYLWVNGGAVATLPGKGAADHRMECEFKPFKTTESGEGDPEASSVGCLQMGVPYLISVSKGQYLTVDGSCLVARDISQAASFQIEAGIEMKRANPFLKPLLALGW
ncbi:unnamed protein product [Symbiodinium natans]|uniref:Uncharacterized protein n=1 Tax=Symbiodinium natans TaxID=878477 RepID=A0A812LF41_9DINO|nr:unnamed protein product [Symbiodinium natans]